MHKILNLWGEISINVLLGSPSSRLPQVWKLPPTYFSYIWNLLKQTQLALWVSWASARPLIVHWQYFPYHNPHSVVYSLCQNNLPFARSMTWHKSRSFYQSTEVRFKDLIALPFPSITKEIGLLSCLSSSWELVMFHDSSGSAPW